MTLSPIMVSGLGRALGLRRLWFAVKQDRRDILHGTTRLWSDPHLVQIPLGDVQWYGRCSHDV